MVVKLYGSARAACPQRVMACLFEKGVDFELIEINLDSGKHKKPEFLNKQPFGQVPVVEDGDLRLFESRAIARYYAAKYADQGTNLLGNTSEERALVDQWLEVESHNFGDPVYNIVLQLLVLPRMGGGRDMELVKSCEQKLGQVLDVYEKQLGKTKYLAGDLFTLADLSHLPGTTYLMNMAGMSYLIRERKNVNAWWEDISSRPSWKKVLKLMI